jgi:hypothetical protein
MSNLLQSSQTVATKAPGYYTDYLTGLADKTTEQLDPTTGAQFIGKTNLQDKAFTGVEAAADSGDTQMTNAQSTLKGVVDSTSPLSSANTYLTNATSNVGTDATGLMSPYTSNVVNAIADAGQRNIMQNLAPQATAGAVGSGQFGSKRGAEVLGQTIQNANKDILNQQYQALNTGYSDALKAALTQNQTEATVGRTAGDLASAGQQNLTAAGRAQAETAVNEQKMNLEGINALATLGEQERTLLQNEELFPLSNLETASGIMRGYTVPTTTTTTMEQSPLSALVGTGVITAGMLAKGANGADSELDKIIKAAKGIAPRFGGVRTGAGSSEGTSPSAEGMAALEAQGFKLDTEGTGYLIKDGNYYALDKDNNPVLVGAVSVGPPADDFTPDEPDPTADNFTPNEPDPTNNGEDTMDGGGALDDLDLGDGNARGGLVRYAGGGMAGSMLPLGGLPQYDQSNTYIGYNNTDGSFIPR